MSSIPQLPQEVTDLAMDFIRADSEQSLISCSLVSRSFSSRSRRLLFSTLTITNHPDLSRTAEKLGTLRQLLQNENFIQLVETVKLVACTKLPEWLLANDYVLRYILGSFNAKPPFYLKKLSLIGGDSRHFEFGVGFGKLTQKAIYSLLGRIEDASFEGHMFKIPTTLLENLPYLKSLVLETSVLVVDHDIGLQQNSLPSQIDRLVISDVLADGLCDLYQIYLQKLTSLIHNSGTTFRKLSDLAHSGNLILFVHAENDELPLLHGFKVDLAPFTRLETLRFLFSGQQGGEHSMIPNYLHSTLPFLGGSSHTTYMKKIEFLLHFQPQRSSTIRVMWHEGRALANFWKLGPVDPSLLRSSNLLKQHPMLQSIFVGVDLFDRKFKDVAARSRSELKWHNTLLNLILGEDSGEGTSSAARLDSGLVDVSVEVNCVQRSTWWDSVLTI
ncbi:hypothetical protein CPB83DRAFT_910797 [Crepidotus variabilis]|uniref:F-box domain-containing protein n=1 Tax=Crepidotus variabilis TaxID=179855 RepID=A0A9P6E6I9_9AGAR|nr:hypothetical protein CPB83DRAFT_910797 [Crepidotus variabilis]